ncbi:hypothetical protein [uncultured Aquimarina sp.]|uniref:hypothetical protein n=1 Tax=uncultured Aquimarina sp. TaxID=575652 RepID=UPI00262936B6|nr:hypothetical protein [uncultured Aquimarina sp.]
MSLHIQYSKQIAKELGKIAVYFPGEDIKVGDVIIFPDGKKGIFQKAVPWGNSERITTLDKLEVPFKKREPSPNLHTYKFSTKNSVDVNFELSGDADLGNPDLPAVDANLSIKFKSEGSIYFLAVDCQESSIEDILELESQVKSESDLIWKNDAFLVTSVTVAKKALIMQANSKGSELVIGGNVQGLKSGTVNISADTNIQVKRQRGSSFIKDWSDNVTVFIEVMKMEKEVFGDTKSLDFESGIPTENTDNIEKKLVLKNIDISEYLKIRQENK